MMDQIAAKRYLYYFIKNKLSIFDLEQWLYNTDELEEIFGKKEYYELIARDYKDKFALHETEKQIRRIINLGMFEQERLELLLNDLLTINDPTKQLQTLEILYEEYCDGYTFLRYIALTFITTSDEYKDILKRDNLKYLNYMNGIRREVIRLLGFFEKKGIMIEEEYEYIDKRADEDRIELHSIDKMLNT